MEALTPFAVANPHQVIKLILEEGEYLAHCTIRSDKATPSLTFLYPMQISGRQDPKPLPYLQHEDKYSFDINLSVAIQRKCLFSKRVAFEGH